MDVCVLLGVRLPHACMRARMRFAVSARHLCNSLTFAPRQRTHSPHVVVCWRRAEHLAQKAHTYIVFNCAFRAYAEIHQPSFAEHGKIPSPLGPPTRMRARRASSSSCRCRCFARLARRRQRRRQPFALYTRTCNAMRDVRACACMFNKIIKEFVFCSKLHTRTHKTIRLRRRKGAKTPCTTRKPVRFSCSCSPDGLHSFASFFFRTAQKHKKVKRGKKTLTVRPALCTG